MILCYFNFDNLLKLVPLVPAVVAIWAIRNYNKINRKHVRYQKLEEIYITMLSVTQDYFALYQLYDNYQEYKNPQNKSINSLQEYLEIRDSKFNESKRQEIIQKIFRLDVLIKCYTDLKLRKDLEEYQIMLFALCDTTLNVSSLYAESVWKKEIPDWFTYYNWYERLTKDIITEIDYNRT